MADREGLRKAVSFNSLGNLTGSKRAIEAKVHFRGLSNRVDPPPERETAAPTGIGNGRECTPKKHASQYRRLPLGTIARLWPNVAAVNHFVVEADTSGAWLTVRRYGREVETWFVTAAEANRARQKLSDDGLIGLAIGNSIWGGGL